MNDTNSSILKTIALVAIVTLGLVFFGTFKNTSKNVGGGFSLGQTFGITYTPNGLSNTYDPNATSTAAFMAADAASTTVRGFIGRAESYDVDMIFNASSTASRLIWTSYYADTNYATTSPYWSSEDCNTATSNVLITHGPGLCVHTWTASVAGINTKRITVDSTQAGYILMKFSVHDAAGSLNVRVMPKEQTPN